MTYFKNVLKSGQGFYYCCFNGNSTTYDFIKVCTLENLPEISVFKCACNKQPAMKDDCTEQEFLNAYSEAKTIIETQLNKLLEK